MGCVPQLGTHKQEPLRTGWGKAESRGGPEALPGPPPGTCHSQEGPVPSGEYADKGGLLAQHHSPGTPLRPPATWGGKAKSPQPHTVGSHFRSRGLAVCCMSRQVTLALGISSGQELSGLVTWCSSLSPGCPLQTSLPGSRGFWAPEPHSLKATACRPAGRALATVAVPWDPHLSHVRCADSEGRAWASPSPSSNQIRLFVRRSPRALLWFLPC